MVEGDRNFTRIEADVLVAWKSNLSYSIVVWVYQGSARVHFENEVIKLLPGQALWIPRRMAHMVEHAADSLALAILIPARHSRHAADELRRIEVPASQTGWMFYLMLLTLSPLHRGQLPMTQVVKHLEHFITAQHSTPTPTLPTPRHPTLASALRNLRADMDGIQRISELARRTNISERTLRRYISTEYGLGFREFRRRALASDRPHDSEQQWQPVPALSTRWMSFPNRRIAIWAYQGRGSVLLSPPGANEQDILTQRLEVGELLTIPDGYAIRLEIDSGALFFPLAMPLKEPRQKPELRLPVRLPRELEPRLLRQAIAHITALRPSPFNHQDVFELLAAASQYPGLRWPDEPRLAKIGRQLLADATGRTCLADLAANHGLSLRSLQREWRSATGESITMWWRTYRMQRAEGMLVAGLPLEAVASRVGFSHVPNFSRAFFKARGRRPGAVSLRGTFGHRNIF
ncbi:helix-turn-helix domain-containing protein [Glutamicibacter sp. PS]|uniref:helix-turn-helix domain-containing protein n=1 Tax=Glutamicibacter sp. PS TaxID=3075634 RepID=UPI00284F0524|nr:helix-turn-helix domain-containing protein [Glutamicibacter sp. PS]MDR4534016.1 helix-turn-helix domain-containing protein [Glutamicibacter sp. PS]